MNRLEQLDDYVSGVMTDAEATTFEETLFEDDNEETVRFFDRSQRLLLWLAEMGGFDPMFGPEVDALKQRVKVHVVTIDPSRGKKMTIDRWPSEMEVIVFHCVVDTRGYEEIEAEVQNPNGTPIKTFRGIVPEPSTGNVYSVCSEPLARMAYADAPRFTRITGVKNGKRETIAEIESVPG